MSWNGTLRCSHCYEQGHNKRSCPKLKAEIAKRRAENPNDWRVLNHDRHRAYTSREGEKRSCTYCDEQGHNRRTCPILKSHVVALQKSSVQWRGAFLAHLQELGLGTGSILTEDHWRQGKVRYLVTGVNWDRLSYVTRNQRSLKVRNLAKLTQGEFHQSLPFTAEACAPDGVLRGTNMDRDIKVLSAKGDITPPDGWVEEGMSVKSAKEELKDMKSWRFKHNHEHANTYLKTYV